MNWWLLSVFMWSTGYGQTFQDVRFLRAHLFGDGMHDVSIRPVINQTSQTQVGVQLTLVSIINFDMTNGRLETMGYLSTIWKDEILHWNETEYKNIHQLRVSDKEVWTPGISQLDALSEENELSAKILQSDGTVKQSFARPFTTFCDINMRFYPDDDHICAFEFISINYANEDIDIVPISSDLDLSNMNSHGEWRVTDGAINIKHRHGHDLDIQSVGIEFVYTFKRQPGFTVLHQVIPLFILKTADVFIHMVPLNSGERISYAVTLLLAFVFWQAVVNEELPKNSSNISILSVLVSACMIVSGISTVSSVILCRVAHFNNDRPIPNCLERLARLGRYGNAKSATKPQKRGIDDVKQIYDKRIDTGLDGHDNSDVIVSRRPVSRDVDEGGLRKENDCESHDMNRDITWKGNSRTKSINGVEKDRQANKTDGKYYDDPDANVRDNASWTEVANFLDTVLLLCNFLVSLLIIIAFILIFQR